MYSRHALLVAALLLSCTIAGTQAGVAKTPTAYPTSSPAVYAPDHAKPVDSDCTTDVTTTDECTHDCEQYSGSQPATDRQHPSMDCDCSDDKCDCGGEAPSTTPRVGRPVFKKPHAKHAGYPGNRTLPGGSEYNGDNTVNRSYAPSPADYQPASTAIKPVRIPKPAAPVDSKAEEEEEEEDCDDVDDTEVVRKKKAGPSADENDDDDDCDSDEDDVAADEDDCEDDDDNVDDEDDEDDCETDEENAVEDDDDDKCDEDDDEDDDCDECGDEYTEGEDDEDDDCDDNDDDDDSPDTTPGYNNGTLPANATTGAAYPKSVQSVPASNNNYNSGDNKPANATPGYTSVPKYTASVPASQPTTADQSHPTPQGSARYASPETAPATYAKPQADRYTPPKPTAVKEDGHPEREETPKSTTPYLPKKEEGKKEKPEHGDHVDLPQPPKEKAEEGEAKPESGQQEKPKPVDTEPAKEPYQPKSDVAVDEPTPNVPAKEVVDTPKEPETPKKPEAGASPLNPAVISGKEAKPEKLKPHSYVVFADDKPAVDQAEYSAERAAGGLRTGSGHAALTTNTSTSAGSHTGHHAVAVVSGAGLLSTAATALLLAMSWQLL